ncbi:MAG: ethanolamine ammonia-lyase reactivating factor EutA [Deltaproteobacteria bacterium]|nr:ethanolamine ammonia-lyase reactivating factor EutA [Deltaproteobacteria bacterium]
MHDLDEGHGHEDFAEIGPDTIIEDIEGLEMFTLKSVGIDIGSSTSHLVFSQLILRREGASLSARFKVAERKVLFRSKIMLTPYLSGTLIDIGKVRQFIEEAYGEAGVVPEDIDTGAVIITGEALKKENAQPIVEYFAKYSGKFICAAAGHNHEALLAAYGCGAVDLSKAGHKTVLNVDMGGGTTKFALVENGIVTQTAAINVGARLIAFDDSNVVTRIEDAGRTLMTELGSRVEIGKKITKKQKEDFAALMAKILFELIERGISSPLARQLMVTAPLKNYGGLSQIDTIVFSGGVSEHVYDRDRTSYGDVGPIFGKNVRDCLKKLPKKSLLGEPAEGIRATVIGAGEYTVQASGNTSYISNPGVLPVFGLKVVRAPLKQGRPVLEALKQSLAKFDLASFASGLALSLSLDEQLDYKTIREVAEGVAAICKSSEPDKSPLYLALDLDVAKSLGGILKEELEIDREVIAIDGIEVGDLDYIDIGEPMGITEVIPVTVKSLMFPGTKLN